MNILTQSTDTKMTSQQIADLIGSRHDVVRKSIERLATNKPNKPAVIQLPPMTEVKQNQSLSPNSKTMVYVFSGEKGKRDSLIVVAQLSPEFTGAIVDRWIELERQVKEPVPQLPTNYIEALEQLIVKEKALIAAQPKIAHYDKVVERDTLLNATTVAQSVGIKSANALNKILEAMRVYNMTCKRGRAFQSWFVDKGYGEMKQGDTGHHQALFTTKGQAWIIDKLGGVISN